MTYQEITNKEVQKTRKPHQCCWCSELIDTGEKARHRVYVGDGFTSDYMHPECYNALLEKPNEYYFNEEGWMPGDFKRGSYEEID
jgi:hypothetical protein